MTNEELMAMLKKGEAVLLNREGKDVTRNLENPEESEETIETKLKSSQLKNLLKKIKED